MNVKERNVSGAAGKCGAWQQHQHASQQQLAIAKPAYPQTTLQHYSSADRAMYQRQPSTGVRRGAQRGETHLDVVTQDLAVTLGTALAQPLATLAASRHVAELC
jgi:hypothetical protein